MKLNHDLHLAYCTNVHRGETWLETWSALKTHTLAVRDRVRPGKPYGIGLRLSDLASRELAEPSNLLSFQRWLDRNDCYVFTINGFPFGKFHGGPVKENVYRPDWTTEERVAYTNRLFDLLGELVPAGCEGSVSTLPGSFKEFITSEGQVRRIRDNIFRSLAHAVEVGRRKGRRLHLGLEPEPLGLFETTGETVEFFTKIRAEHPSDERLIESLGVNYDTCHMAVEYEEAQTSLAQLRDAGIRLSKIHLSSAIALKPTPANRVKLVAFQEDTYLHQVLARGRSGGIARFRDLDGALQSSGRDDEEWRVHFHVPLHCPPGAWFTPTTDHLLGVLDAVAENPKLCPHLEMETYTWEVLPAALKAGGVVGQLEAEYRWCLAELQSRGLAPS